MRRLTAGLGIALLAWGVLAAAAVTRPAGQVTMLIGQGTVVGPDGTVRPLVKGDTVFSGELVTTSPNSYVNLKFTDGALMLLRPSSRFEITDYELVEAPAAPAAASPPVSAEAAPAAPAAPSAPVAAQPAPAAPQDAAPAIPAPLVPAPTGDALGGGKALNTVAATGSRALFRLLRGGLRTVTGAIGRGGSTDYKVQTPVATIGIRGTDYYVIVCDAACAASEANLQNSVGGVIVGVIEGGVFVANDIGQSADVSPGEYLLTLPDGTQVNLPYEPKFVSVDPIPDPKSCQ